MTTDDPVLEGPELIARERAFFACAHAAYEVNRAHTIAVDGTSDRGAFGPMLNWDQLSDKEQRGVVAGVVAALAGQPPNRVLSPGEQARHTLFLCAVRPMARALGLEVTYPQPTDEGCEREVIVANSSNVDHISYDERTQKCRVRFKNGGLYESDGTLTDVEFDAFAMAKSKGEHFAKHLKKRGFSKVPNPGGPS